MKKYDIINYLKGFSIFTIVLMHSMQGYLDGIWDKAISIGGTGAHVFIFCSGFGLCLSYLNKPESYIVFLKKRLSKVYFPYIIVIALFSLWRLYTVGSINWNEVASHIFLYKMFDNNLDISICYHFWFISTIIQFYIFFPFIIKFLRIGQWGIIAALGISITWSSIVAILNYGDYRPWGSFFLQYLWEFVLGMWIAEKIKYNNIDDKFIIKKLKVKYLVGCIIIGMSLNGIMGWYGGILKLYNDIPSMLGYISILLLIYKLNITWITKFFVFTNKISYEWYLIHGLTFIIVHKYLNSIIPSWLVIVTCLISSYFLAWLFSKSYRRVNAFCLSIRYTE